MSCALSPSTLERKHYAHRPVQQDKRHIIHDLSLPDNGIVRKVNVAMSRFLFAHGQIAFRIDACSRLNSHSFKKKKEIDFVLLLWYLVDVLAGQLQF